MLNNFITVFTAYFLFLSCLFYLYSRLTSSLPWCAERLQKKAITLNRFITLFFTVYFLFILFVILLFIPVLPFSSLDVQNGCRQRRSYLTILSHNSLHNFLLISPSVALHSLFFNVLPLPSLVYIQDGCRDKRFYSPDSLQTSSAVYMETGITYRCCISTDSQRALNGWCMLPKPSPCRK